MNEDLFIWAQAQQMILTDDLEGTRVFAAASCERNSTRENGLITQVSG